MRRIAFILAGVTAAGFLSVTPAVADDDLGAHTANVSGHRYDEERRDGYERYNIGGPFGLTAEAGGASRSSIEGFDLSRSSVTGD
ncbi:hypothetical protein ACQPZG_00890 (plasmid) [Streptomyces sp. CA-294286]|uniref:hypothetical protein n=1 Tax=Streptomyces sp. CA-294286 TaxID=3240070 RepID=UPI003D94F9AC